MDLVHLQRNHSEHELRVKMKERAVNIAGPKRNPLLFTILLSLERTGVTSCTSHIKRLDAREAPLRR